MSIIENDQDRLRIWPLMSGFILVGVICEMLPVIAKDMVHGGFWGWCLEMSHELGSALIVAGMVGVVFEFMAHWKVVGKSLGSIAATLTNAEQRQGELLRELERTVHGIGDEIVMTSGMLRNATKVGIEAVYNGRDEEWHRDVARDIEHAKGLVRIAGISLADLCGFWGGKSALHEAMERRMERPDKTDTFQILFADPNGDGLKIRATYEHPGIQFEDTRAHKQTASKIRETLEITATVRKSSPEKVQIRLYADPPVCFIVITEDRIYVEHYHCADRGGKNIVFALKGKTPLYRAYEDHFETLWRDAKEPSRDYYPLERQATAS